MTETRVYLRGVDLFALTERYLAKEFEQLTTPLTVEPKRSSATPKQTLLTVKEEIKRKSYQFEISPGQLSYCLGYRVYSPSGDYSVVEPEKIKGSRCMYCLRKIETQRQALGIPIKRTEINGSLFYHMVDIFCRIECAYGELRRRGSTPLYSQSIQMIAELYTTSTGKSFSELKPSSDPRLLKIFNGPMTWEEYHTDHNVVPSQLNNIYYIPTIEYIEQNGVRV